MKTSEIKKGTKVKLRNGFTAFTMESARKTTTLCDVEGFVREAGSVYTHDIVGVYDANGNLDTNIEYSKSQLTCRKNVKAFLGE